MKPDKSFLILAAALLLLAAGMFVLPGKDRPRELSPVELQQAILDTSRYVDVDMIARRIIEEDPSLMLIDVRSSDRYQEFSLPGALNIPLSEILSPDWEDYLRAPGMDKVLFSNSSLLSEQAWILLKRMNYRDIYVMKGGLNQWADVILTPEAPAPTLPDEYIARYQFRLAASRFFTGSDAEPVTELSAEPVPVIRREKKTKIQGGC